MQVIPKLAWFGFAPFVPRWWWEHNSMAITAFVFFQALNTNVDVWWCQSWFVCYSFCSSTWSLQLPIQWLGSASLIHAHSFKVQLPRTRWNLHSIGRSTGGALVQWRQECMNCWEPLWMPSCAFRISGTVGSVKFLKRQRDVEGLSLGVFKDWWVKQHFFIAPSERLPPL